MSQADQFVAVTGASAEEAQGYLEASGGSLEMAISLFFDSGGAPGGDAAAGTGGGGGGDVGASSSAAARPPWANSTVWGPDTGALPASWMEQQLVFSDDPASHFGLVQPTNGPCGVLAALQAELFVSMWQTAGFSPASQVPDSALLDAIGRILLRCRPEESSPVKLATWAGDTRGTDVAVQDVQDPTQLTDKLSDMLPALKGAGGVVLLVYSAVLTRGVDLVRKDVLSDGGEPPLIAGPFALCSSELVSLLLRGSAGGNVAAYTDDEHPADWPGAAVGLLSWAEIDAGIPIANGLKFPSTPVWLMHGGDHFTVLFATSPVVDEPGATNTLHHWNGLPPAGPRLCTFELTAPNGGVRRAPEKHVKTFVKPKPGEIDDVVQAHTDDKKTRPKEFKTWRFEVVLAVDDPDVSDGGAGDGRAVPEPVFDLGEPVADAPWRCASCYAKRFQTMCFGQNDAGAVVCRHCDKPQREAGWSLWMAYDALPPSAQRRVERRYGPKILALLRTRWPAANADFPEPPPSV
eukprot:m.49932 g.49932  ORF g.49932 m.49932 type:complete len:519 (+) comp12112_c0_seq1:50-1606(+)